MTLYSLFHPVVVYVTAARVNAAAGKPVDGGAFYSHVMRQLDTTRKQATALPDLAPAAETVCAYTAFYIDYMVHEGPFSFSSQWQDIGRNTYHELAGDEKFFDYMRQFLDDDSALATDHLRLMHAMVNSGFSGAYQRHAVELEALMRRVSARIGVSAEADAAAQLLRHNAAPLKPLKMVRPARRGMLAVLTGAAMLTLSTGFYLYVYSHATESLRSTLESTRTLVLEEAYLHAHNTDSLVVSPYAVDGTHKPAPQATDAQQTAAQTAPEEEPQPARDTDDDDATEPENLLQPDNSGAEHPQETQQPA